MRGSSAFFLSCQMTQFLESQGFMDYLERCIMSEESGNNLLDKLQDATGWGQDPISIFPSPSSESEIITVSATEVEVSGTCHLHIMFHTN